ncbi:hypothetical protein SNE40_012220 [Patella caerulea]|uniref:c-SKI SMAD4-binding domain-containing protein n=3 Tax=Patella caerulea TaxID=87958 RepID=A0AAN8JRY0_PATCE
MLKEEHIGLDLQVSEKLDRMSPETEGSSDRMNTPILDDLSKSPSSLAPSSPLSVPSLSRNNTSNNPAIRQNQVTTVNLHNVNIVCLRIDNKERLCLAQISNTLLKAYSYNEIHNRRVALGITCVQCTPVQLEILRRAGAMPVSSRRCGMITKREAERLVKSFLEDSTPPKLPDNFAFEVLHECGWGCTGLFEPSRYNSSRAKCIKCSFCNMYSSPNKFIFHNHRMPNSKYHHPDAANFNSWRRHLKLTREAEKGEFAYAWEDVKAMFNGGSRKRILNSISISHRSQSSVDEPKKLKTSHDGSYLAKTPYANQYPPYNMFSPPNKPYPFSPLPSTNNFGLNYPHAKDLPETAKASLSSNLWGSQSNLPFQAYDLFWANTLAFSRGGGLRNGFYNNVVGKPPMVTEAQPFKHSVDKLTNKKEDEGSDSGSHDRFSAFKPVGRNTQALVEEDTGSLDVDDLKCEGDLENEEIDVTDESEIEKDNYSSDEEGDLKAKNDSITLEQPKSPVDEQDESSKHHISKDRENEIITDSTEIESEVDRVDEEKVKVTDQHLADSGFSDQSDKESDAKISGELSKESLYRELQKEIERKKRMEREVLIMKDTYLEQVKREKSYRDEMAQQLQIVRETLSNELDQERKVRFTLQQKLKEAHDALHNFSCKMLASRHCDDCPCQETGMNQ